ncbi:hypothetical protein BGZ83_010454 [Gryganskiella cystojenkinii]|nr:hypothetical protein BGZ83_010454 [Gryganskiella cystojenkinii]
MNPHRAHKPVDEFDETPIKYPSKFPPQSDGKTPYVIIVGAGIGGLFLAILLDRAGIAYDIFERTPEVKSLVHFSDPIWFGQNTGSVMGINANILPVFEQLGLYEEFQQISLPNTSVQILYGNMKKVARLDTKDQRDLVGYDFLIFHRADLFKFLLSKIPEERVHFNKKVLSLQQNFEGVMIRCADGTTYHSDILVGADGAYSAVRQSLYKQLSDRKLLPASDSKQLNKGYTCLVGTTDPLDPRQYPLVLEERSDYHQVIGTGTPFSWTIFNVKENRLCYVIVCQYATMAECEDEKFRNSEWGPDRSSTMMNRVKDFKIPHGMTLGDLFNLTPRDRISRVYLEDKLFETWTFGRTVLIGDAAHKMLPSAGQGAICAMQDAVVLANSLYDLEDLKQASIETCLKDYREQRYHVVKVQTEQSNINAMILHGQTLLEKAVRYVILKWLPKSVKDKAVVQGASYRPEITFLEPPPRRGTGLVQPQKPSRRYEKEKRMRLAGTAAV